MRFAIVGTRGIPARYGGFETFAEELSTRILNHLDRAPRHVTRIPAMLNDKEREANLARHDRGIADAEDWRRVVQDDIKLASHLFDQIRHPARCQQGQGILRGAAAPARDG